LLVAVLRGVGAGSRTVSLGNNASPDSGHGGLAISAPRSLSSSYYIPSSLMEEN
jgi:hypothetical protein